MLLNYLYMWIRRCVIAFLFFLPIACSKSGNNTSTTSTTPPPATHTTFTNPLLSSGPDPWVIQKDSFYYYTQTFGNRISIFKTAKMSDLSKAPVTTIWSPPANGLYSKNIWAPEIQYLQGKWYAYFAADDGDNKNHRIYVLENASPDPLSGTWNFIGKIADPADKWAIDADVFSYNSQLYLLWSGWPGDMNTEQDIYIAKMKNPWTIDGDRVLLSAPAYSWEKMGAPPAVNEGPEGMVHNGKAFITYSASGCWTDDYSLGLLSLKEGGDPMNAADWTKTAVPVFTKKPENGAYAPGHNGFFKSKDGTEDWIIYHANSTAGQGCGDTRNPRMQKFTWNADGMPNFGEPVQINTALTRPSGE